MVAFTGRFLSLAAFAMHLAYAKPVDIDEALTCTTTVTVGVPPSTSIPSIPPTSIPPVSTPGNPGSGSTTTVTVTVPGEHLRFSKREDRLYRGAHPAI